MFYYFVTVEGVRTAYRESLEIGFENIRELLRPLSGKSVVTADHGEMLGERVFPFTILVWGHMERFNQPQLSGVSWLQPKFDERRDVCGEHPVESAGRELRNGEIAYRLEMLGYAE